ncbi:competence protein CoiA [Salibacterium sp. K-3]
MYSAVTKQGIQIMLHPGSCTPVSASPPYYCPVCSEEVILKQGMVRRRHFAHHRFSSCQSAAESEEHLEGKAVLYQWLERGGAAPELEVSLPMLQRRADLLFTWKGRTYALEFQCASITTAEALKRTQDYLSHGITPIWIYSSSRLRFHGSSGYSIHDFEWTGLREDAAGLRTALTYFSPKNQCIYFLYPRAASSMVVTYADIYSAGLTSLAVSSLVHLPNVEAGKRTWLGAWLRKKKGWRYSRSRWQQHSDSRYVRTLFASRRSDIPFFPAEAGWPVEGSAFIDTLPHYWQSIVLLSFLDVLPLYDSFSFQTAVEQFHIAADDVLRVKQSPLVKNQLETALNQYFMLLTRTSLLQKKGSGWQKINHVYLPRSIDEGYYMDKHYHNRIF